VPCNDVAEVTFVNDCLVNVVVRSGRPSQEEEYDTDSDNDISNNEEEIHIKAITGLQSETRTQSYCDTPLFELCQTNLPSSSIRPKSK